MLNEAKTPPFQIAEDAPVSEDVRLRYRYLDLRRPRLQHNIGLRHRVAMAIRKYFDANGFWEIETPILTKSTPEGARDLPRAEPRAPGRVLRAAAVAADLQADPDDRGHGSLLPDRALLPRRGPARRPPARVHADRRRDVVRAAGHDLRLIEPLMQRIFKEIGVDVRDAVPPDAVHAEAIATLRIGQAGSALRRSRSDDLSSAFRGLRVPRLQADRRRRRRGPRVRVPGGNRYSRSQLDALVDQAKQMGFTGLIWVRPGEPPLSSVKALWRGDASPRSSSGSCRRATTCC